MADNREEKLYGLLGKNIQYSLSPVMHRAAFSHFGISARYELFDKGEEKLDDFWEKNVLGGKLSGFNVTVPYKVKICEMLKNCRDREVTFPGIIVDIVRVVNTVKIEENKLFGYNTDVSGFYDSLIEDIAFDPGKAKDVFVIGAGGAGRAISLFLAGSIGALDINVYDINDAATDSLEKAFKKNRGPGKISIVKPDEIHKKLKKCGLLINATPLGTKEGDKTPIDLNLLEGVDNLVVYDLVYARETELVKRAKEKGLKASNGLGMLINQAAMAFNIWTGKDVKETKKVMRAALPEKIRRT
ncbi:MAG: shikimate dehydrogenase [Candidatus Omnitrophica bacterium]|nr:shikimate dehydrogenase [Candidatus Omnitrophota bacterium]